MATDADLETFFRDATRWREEMLRLRAVVRRCPLTEELKWRQPCYTHRGGNVVIIGALKAHCLLGFFKGALLDDPEDILHLPGENSYVGRQIRFTGVDEIERREAVLIEYINRAIEVERAGLTVDTAARPDPAAPDELRALFARRPEVAAAFESLTPGRRRGYLLHFSAAKKSATRTARIEKYLPRILEGKGMHDR